MDKDSFKIIRDNGELPAPDRVDLSSIVEDIWEAYVESALCLLNELEAAAMQYEAGRNLEENAAQIRRTLHTLKGEAGMTGFMDVHNLCHEAETAFEALAEAGTAADMVLRVKDWITSAIDFACGMDRAAIHDEIDRQENTSEKPKLRALCIEDDPICRRRLEMLLCDFCDCEFAENGRLGFEKYRRSLDSQRPYKLITLDIQMPEWDGHKTLQEIRRLEESRGIRGLDGIKVIMLTSQGTSEHIFGSFREGCEAYVFKSYMGEKLLDEMAKLHLLKAKTLYSIK